MNHSVCAVIVSYNQLDTLKKCLNSALGQIEKIVVVDNNSREQKALVPELSRLDKVHLILNSGNLGLSCALNQGIRYSLDNNYEWTLLLDQDSILAEDMIEEMMKSWQKIAADQRSRTAAIVPVVHDLCTGKKIPSVITTAFLNKKLYDPQKDSFVHFHISSGSLLRNKAVQAVGLLNESFFIDYIDYEYCFRIIESEHRILLSRNSVLMHSLADQSHRLLFRFKEHEANRIYHQTRNRLLLMQRFGRKFRSFAYEETFRLAGKIFKILLLENNKAEKMKMMYMGLIDFFEYRKSAKPVSKDISCV